MEAQHSIYFPPKYGEAKRIWDECMLGNSALNSAVLSALHNWVYFNTEMYDRMTSLGIYETAVRWTDTNDIRYDMTWGAFLRWFHCACIVNPLT